MDGFRRSAGLIGGVVGDTRKGCDSLSDAAAFVVPRSSVDPVVDPALLVLAPRTVSL
jgi:hypothetical protein